MIKAFVRLGVKRYTVKEWKKFDYPHQSVLLRKFDIILTDHKTRGEKLAAIYDKIKHGDIGPTLNKITKGIDDFSRVMNKTKGMAGKPKDLSGLINSKSKKDYSFLTGGKRR